jgi:hypothetical protein
MTAFRVVREQYAFRAVPSNRKILFRYSPYFFSTIDYAWHAFERQSRVK